MNKKGFTLIELLIVISIISILTAIAIPSYIGITRKAARTEAYSNLEALRLLEEQFFAENGRYTISLGANGIAPNNTTGNSTANVTAIRTTANNMLPGFRPGNDSNLVYWILQNVRLPNAFATPYVPGGEVVQTPCFVALAAGVAGTRVDTDVFVIDCNNVRNF